MSRLQNAQKHLAESLAALESAVEQAQNPTAHAATVDSAGTAHADSSDKWAHPLPVIELGQLTQDLTAIEADLKTAMRMIADITAFGLSSGQDKDSF